MAGIINVGAGGGSSLTLPALIFLGLDGATANGTNRIALLIQNIFAIWGFQQEKLNEFRVSLKYAAFTLPGAVIGAIAAVRISDRSFQAILAIIMILIVISMFIPRAVNNHAYQIPSFKRRVALYAALFGIGFYGGFIQVGVGFIIMATLYHLASLALVKVNVHKVFMVLIYTIPALAVFIASGKVAWLPGFALAAGNGLGGWLSARISVKKGEKFIKIILAVALCLIAYKLVM